MKMLRFALFLPLALAAQKRDAIVEVQRDVALLQDSVKTLDGKVTQLAATLQQVLDAANKGNAAAAAIQASLGDAIREQFKQVATGVVTMNSKVDQMAEEFRGLREAVAASNSRLARLEAKLVDLDTAVRTINAPPKPPESDRPAGPPPGVSADQLYKNALADLTSGKLDLALQQFTDYVRYFGTTELAPSAQFNIGEVHRRNNDPEKAIEAYDQVLEAYPENEKTDDAHYSKARMLLAIGKRTDAAEEFRTLIRKYPNSELAAKAKDQLKALGVAAPAGAAARTPKKK
jgi:TolA-binding protein